MRPIWYFVGLMLTLLGAIILVCAITDLIWPPLHTTVLGELHPGLWWGGVMTIAGITFFVLNRNKRIE